RIATSVRIGRPSRVPQLTPAPLARTFPSSTARPGEKCYPASMRIPRTNIERPADSPLRRSRNPITGKRESARYAQKCITLLLMCKLESVEGDGQLHPGHHTVDHRLIWHGRKRRCDGGFLEVKPLSLRERGGPRRRS